MINQQLLDFIKQQLQTNVPKEKIIEELLANGWSKEDVHEGFNNLNTPNINMLDNRAPIPEEKKRSGGKIFLIILLIILLGGGAGLYYFRDNLVNLSIVEKVIDFKNKILGQEEEMLIQTEENIVFLEEDKIQNQEINTNGVITQEEAEALVSEIFGKCYPGECGGVTISVNENNIVSAVFSNYDDSVAFTKKEAVATYQNGVWILGTPTITWACHLNRGHQDFNTTPCI